MTCALVAVSIFAAWCWIMWHVANRGKWAALERAREAEAWSRKVGDAKAKVLEAQESSHLEALGRANDRADKAAECWEKASNEVGLIASDRDHWKVKADDYGAKLEDTRAAAELYQATIAREVETLRAERDQWRESAIAGQRTIDAVKAVLTPKV